jgi:hypothetical protein
MQKVHVKTGRTEMHRSNKIKIKKEEKKVVIDEATKDWNTYIGEVQQAGSSSPTHK